MSILELLYKNLGQSLNKDRLQSVVDNIFFLEEISVLQNGYRNWEYYNHIILNVDIDRKNKKNSYILWIYNKCDSIKKESPSVIVQGRSSLPDIDMDFPPDVREEVIQYLRDKYGHDRVGQIVTYGRLQGKSALKEVLRVNEYCSFEEMNTITAILPSEGAISDQLEEVEDHSIIAWALENESKRLKDYCYIKDGELHGDYSRAFSQAMRLEGIFKSIGKHAAATIVSSEPLENFCPMIKTSRSAEKLIGYDMYSSEDAGAVKMDILGVSSLQKISMTLED